MFTAATDETEWKTQSGLHLWLSVFGIITPARHRGPKMRNTKKKKKKSNFNSRAGKTCGTNCVFSKILSFSSRFVSSICLIQLLFFFWTANISRPASNMTLISLVTRVHYFSALFTPHSICICPHVKDHSEVKCALNWALLMWLALVSTWLVWPPQFTHQFPRTDDQQCSI